MARRDCRLAAATPVATFLARIAPYESWGSSGAVRLAVLWVLILAIFVPICVRRYNRVNR